MFEGDPGFPAVMRDGDRLLLHHLVDDAGGGLLQSCGRKAGGEASLQVFDEDEGVEFALRHPPALSMRALRGRVRWLCSSVTEMTVWGP